MRNRIERQSDREALVQPVIDFADLVSVIFLQRNHRTNLGLNVFRQLIKWLQDGIAGSSLSSASNSNLRRKPREGEVFYDAVVFAFVRRDIARMKMSHRL